MNPIRANVTKNPIFQNLFFLIFYGRFDPSFVANSTIFFFFSESFTTTAKQNFFLKIISLKFFFTATANETSFKKNIIFFKKKPIYFCFVYLKKNIGVFTYHSTKNLLFLHLFSFDRRNFE